jgi:hypothetical protein
MIGDHDLESGSRMCPELSLVCNSHQAFGCVIETVRVEAVVSAQFENLTVVELLDPSL